MRACSSVGGSSSPMTSGTACVAEEATPSDESCAPPLRPLWPPDPLLLGA
jgi:hypothetical protein